MNNTPQVKLGIVAVSRDCFPMELSVNRRKAIVKAFKGKYGDIYECPTAVENEMDMGKALAEVKEAGVNALVVFLGNFGPETPETLLAKKFDGPVMFAAAAEESGDNLQNGRGDAYCGMLNASYNLALRNIKAYIPEYPVGTATEVAEMISEFVPVASALLGLKNLKIITFGPRPQDFLACNAPIKQLYNLGVEIEENSELDLFAAFNAHEIPINRPVVQFHNNQRDGHSRQTINTGNVSYHNNSLAGNTPKTISQEEGGYAGYQEKVEGNKVCSRSKSFEDHFSQAAMFYNSMSSVEKKHIIDAFKFELSKVNSKEIRQQVINMFGNVNIDMMTQVAQYIGADSPKGEASEYAKISPALNQENTIKKPDTLKVGVILSEGFNADEFNTTMKALKAANTMPEIIGPNLSSIKGSDGTKQMPKHTLLSADPVLFDAVYVLGGDNVDADFKMRAKIFIEETYRHFKPISVSQSMAMLLNPEMEGQPGVTASDGKDQYTNKFIADISAHRHWNRKII